MISRILLSALVGLLPVSEGFAGDERGNGGDAVICELAYPELNGKKAMTLDNYETAHRYGYQVDLGDSSLSVDEKARLAVNRISVLDPDRHQLLTTYLDSFWNEARIGIFSLPSLPDEGVVELPGEDCEIVQLAYQKEPEWPQDKRYTIRKIIWDQLSKDSKAGLVLHEIVYREAITLGHTNSRSSRYYLAHLLSNQFKNYSGSDYADLLDKVNFPGIITFKRIKYDLESFRFGRTGKPEGGFLNKRSLIGFKFGNFATFPKGTFIELYPSGEVQTILRAGMGVFHGNWKLNDDRRCSLSISNNESRMILKFYPDRVLRSISYHRWLNIPICYGSGEIVFLLGEAKSNTFQFYQNGQWYGGWASNTNIFEKLKVGENKSLVNLTGRIDFYENSLVKRVSLALPEILYHVSGELRDYQAKTQLHFNEKGLVSNP